MHVRRLFVAAVLLGAIAATARAAEQPAAVDFSKDVRPILSRHCFKCHGPDDKARQASLRLDVREKAIAEGESGERPIVPAKPDESALVRRIFSDDPDEMMPPPTAKNPLPDAAKQVLKQWIAAGAEYKQHWAFIAPRKAPLPNVAQTDWPRNPIDTFTLARLDKEGLRPSPPADPYTLIRRAYLDLIGLPPAPDEADAFAANPSPEAYERLVDRLLSSPRYGERWARRWLDLARYADTNGYEKDRPRSMWPYRDWVIGAINRDLPFDQFTIEQIAGDMLPGATLQQRIATGFHRNTMINEEGGIDPLEFRFHAMTDRTATTGVVWLGLTLGCAQCHSHKYDPIPQREYYQLRAMLNNADEPVMPVPQPDIAARRADIAAKVAAIEADLPNRFPLDSDLRWETPKPASVVIESGAVATTLDDGSLRLSGATPDEDVYTIGFDAPAQSVAAIRLEALADPQLPSQGPGRTPHGNFVLTELSVSVAPASTPDKPEPVKLTHATADHSQQGFPPEHAIDGKSKTGWAIQGEGNWNVNRTATFLLDKPVSIAGPARWTVRLEQRYGGKHVLGRFRLMLGQTIDDPRPVEARRKEAIDAKFTAWLAAESARAVRWNMLRPASAKANVPILTLLPDSSVLASGDASKRDVYEVSYNGDWTNLTAIRLETLPDESLPSRGPGRVHYEGSPGDFFISDLTLLADGKPVKLARPSHTFAQGNNNSAAAIDESPYTGWSINGGQGRPHAAVFNLETPLPAARSLMLTIVCERYYASGVGRFRLSVASTGEPAVARGLPPEIEDLLLVPADRRTAQQRDELMRYYLSVAPELSAEHQKIAKLREQMPSPPTTLVLVERPAGHTRPTFIHKRGEFTQPSDPVQPDVLSFLPKLPADTSHDRLALARWLVDPANPLTRRVTVNRHWAAFFGRGIVRTTEDFGFQGELPTHPELLDWLAVELLDQGWSIKRLHRLIVTSATYRQSSTVTPALLEKDPQNRLLARGPRFRIEAELVRDVVLESCGMLSDKIGGPSVFPPQPPGVSSEGAYGPLEWRVSQGDDRYRRGMYTFCKRTAPYAMLNTFDAPSGEACVARREVSNSPLQALTMLNDAVILDAARGMVRRLVAWVDSPESRGAELWRRCLSRPPRPDELSLLVKFYHSQKQRLASGELSADKIAGPGPGDAAERAAWTLAARAVLNLDEVITKQ